MTCEIEPNGKKYIGELMQNQLKTISPARRLLYKDLVRISKFLSTSLWDKNSCCMWLGYVTSSKHSRKGSYITFFYRNKKVALHRILYDNFVGELDDNHYLKFTCENVENRGRCCNIYHMVKHKYNVNEADDNTNNTNDEIAENISNIDINEKNDDSIVIEFN